MNQNIHDLFRGLNERGRRREQNDNILSMILDEFLECLGCQESEATRFLRLAIAYCGTCPEGLYPVVIQRGAWFSLGFYRTMNADGGPEPQMPWCVARARMRCRIVKGTASFQLVRIKEAGVFTRDRSRVDLEAVLQSATGFRLPVDEPEGDPVPSTT